MPAVVRHALGAIFSSRNEAHQHMVHTQHSSAAAVHNSQLSPELWPSSPKLNSNNCTTRFIKSHNNENINCKSAVLKIKHLLVELRETCSAAFKR